MIDILSSISFADDYKEVQRLENGMISAGEPSHDLEGFTQLVVSITGSLRDREVACSASDRQGSNF